MSIIQYICTSVRCARSQYSASFLSKFRLAFSRSSPRRLRADAFSSPFQKSVGRFVKIDLASPHLVIANLSQIQLPRYLASIKFDRLAKMVKPIPDNVKTCLSDLSAAQQVIIRGYIGSLRADIKGLEEEIRTASDPDPHAHYHGHEKCTCKLFSVGVVFLFLSKRALPGE